MVEFTDEVKSDLQAKYQEICAVEVAGQVLVFRKPSPPEYDRWYDGYSSGTEKSKRSRELASACLVWPARSEFEAAIKAKPASLTSTIDTEIIKLAGAGSEDCRPLKL